MPLIKSTFHPGRSLREKQRAHGGQNKGGVTQMRTRQSPQHVLMMAWMKRMEIIPVRLSARYL
ncbi:MAG: hypothetical protein ACXWID_12725 [Pyrinomonadaceae bacterium]